MTAADTRWVSPSGPAVHCLEARHAGCAHCAGLLGALRRRQRGQLPIQRILLRAGEILGAGGHLRIDAHPVGGKPVGPGGEGRVGLVRGDAPAQRGRRPAARRGWGSAPAASTNGTSKVAIAACSGRRRGIGIECSPG